MDIATVFGLVFGCVLIFGSIALGGGAMIFVHVPSMCIVLGGTLCTVMTHFSLSQFLSIFTIVKKTFMVKVKQPSEIVQEMINFAAISRRWLRIWS